MRWGTAVERALCSSNLPLVALRIVTAGLCLVTDEPARALDWLKSGAPAVPPAGLAWFAACAPLDVTTASRLRVAYYVAASLVLVGLYSRIAGAVLLVSATYLFAIASMGGAVFHDMHILWFIAILLVSSAGDTWSLDAHFDGRAPFVRTPPARSTGIAVFVARTLLGLIYFFPGFHKLRESGLAWALSDNLRNQMHAKWLEHGAIPWPRIDHAPLLLRCGGLLVLAFELSFLFVVHVGPRARLLLAVSGILFHLFTERFLFIPFSSLWLPYVVLFDLPKRFFRGVSKSNDAESKSRMGHVLSAIVGAALITGAAIQGARGKTQSFPFACYPTFQWILSDRLPDLQVTAIGPSLPLRDVPIARDPRGKRTQGDWGAVWSVAGIYGAPFSEERLVQFLRAESQRKGVRDALEGATELRVELVLRSVDPERWNDPPLVTRRVAVVPLPLRRD